MKQNEIIVLGMRFVATDTDPATRGYWHAFKEWKHSRSYACLHQFSNGHWHAAVCFDGIPFGDCERATPAAALRQALIMAKAAARTRVRDAKRALRTYPKLYAKYNEALTARIPNRPAVKPVRRLLSREPK